MNYVLAAISLGLVAGLNPGPLGVFVIHQTMTKGNRYGFLACLIPIISDTPIIVFILLLSTTLSEQSEFLVVLSMLGASYLAYLAFLIVTETNQVVLNDGKETNLGWLHGLKMNFLNPAPYLFWGAVSVTYIISNTLWAACLFIAVTLITLCLTKFAVALVVRTLGKRFSPKVYAMILKALAIPLLFYCGKLLLYGITYFSQR